MNDHCIFVLEYCALKKGIL